MTTENTQAQWGALLAQTAALMERFERSCDTIAGRQAHAIQQLPAQLKQSADDVLRSFPASLENKAQAALERPTQNFGKQLDAACNRMNDRAQTLDAQLQRVERLHRQLAWKIIVIVIGSLALLLAGGGWLMNQYRADIRANQISAELLRAYNQADVVLCGSQLCANVEMRGAGTGDRQQYRLVLPRALPASAAAAAASR